MHSYVCTLFVVTNATLHCIFFTVIWEGKQAYSFYRHFFILFSTLSIFDYLLTICSWLGWQIYHCNWQVAKVQWCVCGWTNIRISRCLCRWVFGSWCWCGGQKVQPRSLLSSLSFTVGNSYCNVELAIWDKIALQVVTSNYSDIYMMDQSLYIDFEFQKYFLFWTFLYRYIFSPTIEINLLHTNEKHITCALSFLWVSTITKKAFYPKQVGVHKLPTKWSINKRHY